MTGRPPDLDKRRERQDRFLEAFAQTGILAQAAEQSGIVAPQHHRWVKDDPDYAQRFAALKEQTQELAKQKRRPHPRGYRVKGQRGRYRIEKQEAFLAALANSGVIADAARESGIALVTPGDWAKKDTAFAARYEQVLNDTEELRKRITAERLGRASRARWDDPERRAEWSQLQRDRWTPEMRAELAERMRNLPEDVRKRGAAKAWSHPERRQRQSDAMKLRWADPDHKALMAERMTTPEAKEKQSQGARAQWAAMTPEERTARMRRMRRVFKGGHRLTRIEAKTMMALNDRELPYFVHKPIGDYVADVLIPSMLLVVECDGAFHHAQRVDGDAARDAVLAEHGYRVLRLSEQEITDGNWDRLDQAINQGLP